MRLLFRSRTDVRMTFFALMRQCVFVGLSVAVLGSPATAGTLRDDAIAFVKLGYGDQVQAEFRSLNFLTDELDTETAQAVVALVDQYNAYDGGKVAAALGRFKGRIDHYRFGRDQSPVLFIALPYWTSQREHSPDGDRGERIDAKAHAKMVEELRKVFVDELQADEFSVDPIFDRTLRVWWD